MTNEWFFVLDRSVGFLDTKLIMKLITKNVDELISMFWAVH